MDFQIKRYFLEAGYSVSYERFVQVAPDNIISVPGADAVLVTTSSLIAVDVSPSRTGADAYTVRVSKLFVIDEPTAAMDLILEEGSSAVVRITGFTKNPVT